MKKVVPPLPRKEPKQNRSVFLVDSLKEACLIILKRDGAEYLTIANLSAESGVTSASIYDYFPNVEALIAATLDDLLWVKLEKLQERIQSLPTDTPLSNVVRMIVEEGVIGRNEVFKLAPELYLKFVDHYEVRDDVSPYDHNRPDAFAITKKLLAPFQDQITTRDFDFSVFLFLRGMQSIIRSILEERTEKAASQHTIQLLTSMFVAVLREDS